MSDNNMLIKMKIHDNIFIGNDTTVLKVIGGWIYTKKSGDWGDYAITSCFVPYIENKKIRRVI